MGMEIHVCTGGGQSQKQAATLAAALGRLELGAACRGSRLWIM